MEEYMDILLNKPFGFTEAGAIEDRFLVFAFEWELEQISLQGIQQTILIEDKHGVYCTKLDADLEKRDQLLQMKLKTLDWETRFCLHDNSALLDLIRPVIVTYSGQVSKFGGYLHGEGLDGICMIPENIPAHRVEISPKLQMEPLSNADLQLEKYLSENYVVA